MFICLIPLTANAADYAGRSHIVRSLVWIIKALKKRVSPFVENNAEVQKDEDGINSRWVFGT